MRLTVYFPEDSPTTHELVENRLTIGRLSDNDLQLDDASVSGRHAEIVIEDGGAILRDLNSTNGTQLQGAPLTGEHPLHEGDEIYLGNVRAVFMTPALVAAVEEPGAPVTSLDSGVGRPSNFHYMSPLPRKVEERDKLTLAAWACAGLGLVAAIAALVVTVTS